MENNKKVVLICTLLITSIFTIVSSSVVADENIIYVDDDASADWYDETHVRTIQEGIDYARDGNIIYVYIGVYYENVVLDKSIELIGENKDSTLIDGSGLDTVLVTAEDVKISGFTIQNTNKDYPDECRGIVIYSNNIIIFENIIKNNKHGIVFNNNSNIEISKNQFVDNNWAIVTMSSHNAVISNNIIIYNENEDDYVHHSGLAIYESTGFSITDNLITSDDGLTLLIEFTSDSSILQNNITGSFCGIILRGCNNIIISENNIENNRHGIELATSANVEIIRNNFIGNNLHAFFSKSILWDLKLLLPLHSKNIWDNNYWDRPRLIPYPIFGGMGWVRPTDYFVYHPITWIEFDLHPAKEPYEIGGE